ncbi:MAG: HD domain-containing protein [Candidatus Magasanikbacteria bacterium]|nr:HD domain-containing protein [Candidatus Magasanikbacteria bacterium]
MTTARSLIDKTAGYVKTKLYNEASGHDWYHVERVWKMARKLQAAEGGDLELIELSALLHNLGDHDFYKFSEKKGSLILFGMMDIIGIEEPIKDQIITVVNESKYGGIETRKPRTLEGRIVQDANFLDTLGAIGVARHFASGGYHGRLIYDPDIKVRAKLTRYAYEHQKDRGTSINNFYEKAFRVAELMNTDTAKKIAQEKVVYIKNYVEQFLKEWDEYAKMQF